MTAADALKPLIEHLFDGVPPLRMRFWDGSELLPAGDAGDATKDASADGSDGATIVVTSPRAVRRLLWQPNELGLGRAYVAGEIDI